MKKVISLMLALLLCCAPALASAETVVASFYPIYLFALNLLHGVEGVELASLAEPTSGCLHDYQLQTSDMKALAQADVFLINGAGMEGYLDGVFEAFPTLPVADASKGVELLEDCAEHDHDHDDHGHEHAFNAHIWLDAENAILMVNNLADGLIAALPRPRGGHRRQPGRLHRPSHRPGRGDRRCPFRPSPQGYHHLPRGLPLLRQRLRAERGRRHQP